QRMAVSRSRSPPMIPHEQWWLHGSGGPIVAGSYRRDMQGRSFGLTRWLLLVLVVGLSLLAGAAAQVPGLLGLAARDPEVKPLNALIWASIGAIWLVLVFHRARSAPELWTLPSSLFR